MGCATLCALSRGRSLSLGESDGVNRSMCILPLGTGFVEKYCKQR